MSRREIRSTFFLILILVCPGIVSLLQAKPTGLQFVPAPDKEWNVATPEEAGFDAKKLNEVLVQVAQSNRNIHSVLIERNGRMVAELYREGSDRTVTNGLREFWSTNVAFGPDTLHDVRSVSKSVTALLFGITQGRGNMPEPRASLLSVYPELSDLRTPVRDAITFEHLLTMSSGLKWKEWNVFFLASDETWLFWKSEHLRFLINRDQASEPGTKFNYNGGSTAALAETINRMSGKSFLEVARQDFFEPLGITNWQWATDLRDRPVAYAGLRLRPRDMLKIGRLAIENGKWKGKQIVPESWMKEVLKPRISTGVRLMSGNEDEAGYGYQWWNGYSAWHNRKVFWNAAIGNGGQRIYIVPELDLTIAVTAGEYGTPSIQKVVGQICDDIVSSIE